MLNAMTIFATGKHTSPRVIWIALVFTPSAAADGDEADGKKSLANAVNHTRDVVGSSAGSHERQARISERGQASIRMHIHALL